MTTPAPDSPLPNGRCGACEGHGNFTTGETCTVCGGDGAAERAPAPPDPRDAELATLRAQLAEVTAQLATTKRNGHSIIDTYEATHARTMHELVGLRAQVATLTAERDFAVAFGQAITAERDEARAHFLRCAQAIGVVYEADGIDSHPGPIEAVEHHIREAARKSGDLAEARAEVERMRASAEDVARSVLRAFFDDPDGFRSMKGGDRARSVNAALLALTSRGEE